MKFFSLQPGTYKTRISHHPNPPPRAFPIIQSKTLSSLFGNAFLNSTKSRFNPSNKLSPHSSHASSPLLSPHLSTKLSRSSCASSNLQYRRSLQEMSQSSCSCSLASTPSFALPTSSTERWWGWFWSIERPMAPLLVRRSLQTALGKDFSRGVWRR